MHFGNGLKWCSLCCGLIGFLVLNLSASDRMEDDGSVGLLVMAHGGKPEWNAAVEAAVAPLRETCPIQIAFGMASPITLQAAFDRLEEEGVRRVGVVRLFVSSESFRHQTEYLLGLRPDPPSPFLLHLEHGGVHELHLGGSGVPPPIRRGVRLVMAEAGLSDSSLMGEILADRVRTQSQTPTRESVLVLAHGEGDEGINRQWMKRLHLLSDRIRQVGDFRRVQVDTLREDWKDKRIRAERRIRAFVDDNSRSGGRVIVIPFRVFGFGPYAEVLSGLDYVADGRGLLPHRLVTEWIREQAVTCFQKEGWSHPFD